MSVPIVPQRLPMSSWATGNSHFCPTWQQDSDDNCPIAGNQCHTEIWTKVNFFCPTNWQNQERVCSKRWHCSTVISANLDLALLMTPVHNLSCLTRGRCVRILGRKFGAGSIFGNFYFLPVDDIQAPRPGGWPLAPHPAHCESCKHVQEPSCWSARPTQSPSYSLGLVPTPFGAGTLPAASSWKPVVSTSEGWTCCTLNQPTKCWLDRPGSRTR